MRFVSFCVRFVGGNKISFKKKRENKSFKTKVFFVLTLNLVKKNITTSTMKNLKKTRTRDNLKSEKRLKDSGKEWRSSLFGLLSKLP